MDAHYEVVWPSSPLGIQTQRKARRLATLNDKRVAFLWDYVFRGDERFPVLDESRTQRFGYVEIMSFEEFGNLHGADEKERIERLPDDLRSRGVDAVVSGMGC